MLAPRFAVRVLSPRTRARIARGVVLGVLALLLMAPAALAQPPRPVPPHPLPPSFDEKSGRSLLNYPPHAVVHIEHVRVDLEIPDMNVPRASAVEHLKIKPLAATSAWALDASASSIKVSRVSIGVHGSEPQGVPYVHAGEKLTLTFNEPLTPGLEYDVTIDYVIDHPPAGLNWLVESKDWPDRPAQIHTQGETMFAHHWLPIHDFPNEKMTTEMVVTVPDGYEVSSNGRLVSREPTALGAMGSHFVTWHWLQDKPHASYLISIVVGKFDVVDVSDSKLPMPVYVPQGQGPLVKGTFGRTPDMVRLFADYTGQPYAWDRYAQVICWNFQNGGMENTSCTSLHDTAVLDETALLDGDNDSLIAHELAHQWFGDLITCDSWAHLWLNEGFAVFFERLWQEHHRGKDDYYASFLRDRDTLVANDHADAPRQPGIVSNQYVDAEDVFRKPANPYSKGAFVLHMLRTKLGEETFKAGIRTYVQRMKFKVAETDDFRKAMEDASGLSLERFFHQWCIRPGVPALDVKLGYDADKHELSVSVDQTQPINADNPAFFFDLPVWVKSGTDADAPWTKLSMFVETKHAEMTFPLADAPRVLCVDPELAVLADVHVTGLEAALAKQTTDGPTLVSKVQGLAALTTTSSQGAADPLPASLMLDAKLHPEIRGRAADALVRQGRADLVRQAINQSPDSARARGRFVNALVAGIRAAGPGHADPADVELLTNLVQHDPSYDVRADALRGLGAAHAEGSLDTILAAASTPSQDDKIRSAALSALADLDAPAGLDAAIAASRPSMLARTRPGAASAIGKLAHHDPAKAVAALKDMLSAPDDARTRMAAATALATIDSPEAKAALKDAARKAATEHERRGIEELLSEKAASEAK